MGSTHKLMIVHTFLLVFSWLFIQICEVDPSSMASQLMRIHLHTKFWLSLRNSLHKVIKCAAVNYFFLTPSRKEL